MTFWLSVVFFGSAFLLVYPFCIYPLLLCLFPKAALGSVREAPGQQSFALLIAARNEAAALPEMLQSLRALKREWPDLRIMVWNDASDDSTGYQLDRARRHIDVFHGAEPGGKALAIRNLLKETDAEVVLFMDANVRFRADRILKFRDRFSDPMIGAVGARLVPDGGAAGSAVGRMYWQLEEWIKARESRIGSTIGLDGAAWGIRRALYPPFDIAESDDFRPSMEALLRGSRVIVAPEIEVREAAIPDAAGAGRAMRIGCGAWHAHRRIWPDIRRLGPGILFKYVSHKLIRWFAGLWLVLAVATGAALMVMAGQAGPLAVALLAGVAGWLLHLPVLAGLSRAGAMFVATTLGIFLAMGGKTIASWRPIRP